MQNQTQNNDKDSTLGILNKYAQLIVSIPNLGVKTFSYLIPDELKPKIKLGQAVIVSFGNKGLVNAFVVGFSNYLPEGIKAKEILEIIDETPVFNLNYLNFLQWGANYYCVPLQTMIEAAVPMKFLKQSTTIATLTSCPSEILPSAEFKIIEQLQKGNCSLSNLLKKTKIPTSKFYAIIRKLRQKKYIKTQTELKEKNQKSQSVKFIKKLISHSENKRQDAILSQLNGLMEVELIKFEKQIKTTRKTLIKMADDGLVEIFEKEIFRNPLDIYKPETIEDFPALSDKQSKVCKFIKNKIDEKSTEPILIHGVTASGKTEIYMNAIKHVLEQGKNVLFLAPEIMLASELTKRLARRFGTETVSIWHSSISDGERYDIWERLRKNEIRILAGARSAVFAPLKNIGLIIIDEEHENSYKQTSPTPRYNAKTIAEQLAKINQASLVLGSATPDICAYYRAANTGNLLELTERFNNAKMAKVITVDMRSEKMNDNKMLFSRSLVRALNENLENKKQSIILINRRGFATTTQCEACGQVLECKKCAIPLVWHANEGLMKCHYCDYTTPYPKTCPECGAETLSSFGIGIEKVEQILKKILPNAKIARMDSDILSKKNLHVNILEDFRNGEIDILVGTQMIAKGLDNPNVTLVGVVNADNSFAFPDFRSAERGFQLLTQVAGRAGRGEVDGKVYFQTFNPEFYVLDNAKNQDYKTFYTSELEAREFFDYPPFSQIFVLIISAKEQWKAKQSTQIIAEKLREIIIKKEWTEYLNVLGPSPCIIERIRDEYRFQILIKNKLGEQGHRIMSKFFSQIILPEDIKLIIDVDPLDLL